MMLMRARRAAGVVVKGRRRRKGETVAGRRREVRNEDIFGVLGRVDSGGFGWRRVWVVERAMGYKLDVVVESLKI